MSHNSTPAEKIALWADELRSQTAMGLRFAKDIYEEERYQALQTIAMKMMALATDKAVETFEPLRETVFSRPTPLSVGDAGIIDEAGRILLIQRADNAHWAMPGGALEVGETPAEGVVREALEETGVLCKPVALVGVFDSRLAGSRMSHHLYIFVFLCQPVDVSQLAQGSHAHEVLDVRWFAEDALPESIAPTHRTRIPEVFRLWRGDQRAFFDS